MILVTGAAGKTGLAVTKALWQKGIPTRALVRRAEQEPLVRHAGAKQVIIGDALDEAVSAKALTSIEAVYLICPNVHPKELEIGQKIIALSKTAKVKRIVYHSVLFPQIEAMPHHWQKLRVEEALLQSGLNFTILQPASYMQNILPYWEAITQRGEYFIPYSVDSVFSPVDLKDVAKVASQILEDWKHDGAIYPLAGSQWLNSRQMAELMGKALGREVRASSQPLADWIATAQVGQMPPYALDALTRMFVYYDKHGFSGSSLVLENLLSRPATTFSQFLNRLPK
ncbi:MAG: NmrA family NAD(P)-binding protein [Chloroflexi bacterium]|nr:NmrA family NAD(P)-binding protein [Chloroflexota bacterium]